jgi:acyl carrier protein
MSPHRLTIERELVTLLADTAQIESTAITPTSGLAEIGIDSVQTVELIFEIEDRYGISIDYNANDGAIETMGSLVELVTRLVEARAEARAAHTPA